MPFVKSVGGFGNLMTEYDAKNARRDKLAEGLYTKAKELMKKIEEADKKAWAGDAQEAGWARQESNGPAQQGLATSWRRATLCDGFSKTYRSRLDIYRKMEGKALGRHGKRHGYRGTSSRRAATADTIVTIAQALA